jgi:hypothetical protein
LPCNPSLSDVGVERRRCQVGWNIEPVDLADRPLTARALRQKPLSQFESRVLTFTRFRQRPLEQVALRG